MRRIGICKKCGKCTTVQDHHSKGYLPPHQDFTEPYCRSCDAKAHAKAKKEGKCNLKPCEISKLTNRSWVRRSLKPRLDKIKANYKLNKSINRATC